MAETKKNNSNKKPATTPANQVKPPQAIRTTGQAPAGKVVTHTQQPVPSTTVYKPPPGAGPCYVPQPFPAGNISFASIPPGAEIFIDGNDQGAKTQNTAMNVPAGDHAYTLKLTGYNDYSGTVSVVSGQTAAVSAVMTQAAPSPAPAPAPVAEATLTELLQRIVTEHEAFSDLLARITAIQESLTTATKAEDKYYDTPLTAIAVATPVQPNSPDTFSNATTVPPTPGYQTETIYATLQRNSPKMFVINDGTDHLYVITSPDGKNWSSEVTILTGEARTFFNVFEVRLRSPSAGTLTPVLGGVYRVIERDFWLAYIKPVAGGAPNRAAFIAQNIVVPDLLDHTLDGLDAAILAANPGNVLPIAVPSGFALVIRGNVNNVGVVYISASNATTVVARDTLNPGDTSKLLITNSSLVHVAVANANDSFDILVEQ